MTSTLFVFGFWLSIVIGYNLSVEKINREEIFTGLSYVFLMSGTATGVIAICQWLTLDAYIPGMVDMQRAVRPYVNFAQPNNMATFLLMSLLACLYLYETKKVQTKWLVPAAFIMLMSVALSQSRTSWVACVFILVYLAYQQFKGYIYIKWRYLAAWLAVFIGLVLVLPVMGSYLTQLLDIQIKAVDVARRATGDMSRLAIWQQMLHAIADRPWFGYGWNQTSVAYPSQ